MVCEKRAHHAYVRRAKTVSNYNLGCCGQTEMLDLVSSYAPSTRPSETQCRRDALPLVPQLPTQR